jgi:hypothetical protein
MDDVIIDPFQFGSNLPLDIYPGATVAYSLRYLTSSYTGPVVRVRRGSDNTEQDFTPSGITSGALVGFCGSGDGFVRTFYDQVGSNHLQQTTSFANQPRIVVAGSLQTLNSKPSIRMAANAGLSLTNAINLGPNSIFCVLNLPSTITSASTSQVIWRGSSATFDGFSFGATTSTLENERVSWLTLDPANPGGVFGVGQVTANIASGSYLYSTLWSGTTPSIFQNNTQFTLTPTTSGGFTSTIYPRTFLSLSSLTNGLTGNMAEFIIYNSNQAANRAAIATEINSHYSIF